MTDITELVKHLAELKEKKKRVEEELTAINKEIQLLAEKEIPEFMDENDLDKVTVSGVGTCYLRSDVRAYVKADDREAFHQWLKETNNGELIKETVHPTTLKAFAKESLSNGKQLPEFISATSFLVATVRKG